MVIMHLRKYEKHDYRLRKIHLDFAFLNSYLDNDLCPTFLRYKLSSKRLQNSESYRRSQQLLLQVEIAFKTIEREKIIRELQKSKNDLRTVMDYIDWTHVSNKFTKRNIKAKKRVEEIQNYKLSELMGTKLQHDPEKVICNYSSYNLNQTEISLLHEGLNFSLPPQKLEFENHLPPFELLYRDVINDERKDDDVLMHLKSKTKDVGLSSFRLYNKKGHLLENLTEDEYETLLNLESNKNIIIQKADKGNSVVVIDRLKCVHKMEEFLSDHSKFVKIEFNSKHTVDQHVRHLLDMELEIKSCLDDLLNKNYLSKDDYKYLKPCGSKPGIMHGLCKIHNVTTVNDPVPPFRPILSAISTCSYNLAKFFVPILKQFTINKYTVKDYFSFCKEILDQDPNLFMTSFDIQSLFANILFDETINICVDFIFRKKKNINGKYNT